MSGEATNGGGDVSGAAAARDGSAAWHAMSAEKVLGRLESSEDGLTRDEAARRLERDGPNSLEQDGGTSLPGLFFKQLKSPLIYLLLAATAVSLAVQQYVDAGVILTVVVLNTVLGVVQEWRAEKALEALRELSAPDATVVRDGQEKSIPAEDVVVGDVLVLDQGERVAADARLLDVQDLRVDESALTGESEPVDKSVEPVEEGTPRADRADMVWMSTGVTAGDGHAVVVATGMDSAMGSIAGEVRGTERTRTPLQQRLDRLGKYIGAVAVGVAFAIFGIGLLRGFELVEMLLFAVAAAVSAIPEGLPAVVTVVLAIGVRRMAERNAIIRRLPAVETLGSTTVICSDKTGTITRNQMTVTRLWTAENTYEVEGEGLSGEGEILGDTDGEKRPADTAGDGEDLPDTLRTLLEVGVLANESSLERDGGEVSVEGEPTEAALLVVAGKAGIERASLDEEMTRRDLVPFSSKRKYMASLNETGRGQPRLHVKGAPEVVLAASSHLLRGGERVPLDEEARERIREANRGFAGSALRVMAAAVKDAPGDGELEPSQAEEGLTFVGLWGLLDPPRQAAIDSIAAAQKAGIRVVMVTGDHAETAAAIAAQVGIAEKDAETLTGSEVEELADEELARRAREVNVYARVSPSAKHRIVQALRASEEVVAVTGDGVNDAPALKEASIGVAMGQEGTEVAKEAADMVLADDDFATIVTAVEEGRGIFHNLRKVVFFLVTANLGEILTLASALVVGLPLPLTPAMILWVNLVTEGACTIPVGLEPQHEDRLAEKPRPPGEGVFDRLTLTRMATLAPLIAIGTLAMFAWRLETDGYATAQTVAFATLAAFQWFQAFNARSERRSVFSIGLFSNRWLLLGVGAAVALQLAVIYLPPAQAVFRTVPLSAADWGLIVAASASILVVEEVLKRFRSAGDRSRSG